jgi:hypothetical protein
VHACSARADRDVGAAARKVERRAARRLQHVQRAAADDGTADQHPAAGFLQRPDRPRADGDRRRVLRHPPGRCGRRSVAGGLGRCAEGARLVSGAGADRLAGARTRLRPAADAAIGSGRHGHRPLARGDAGHRLSGLFACHRRLSGVGVGARARRCGTRAHHGHARRRGSDRCADRCSAAAGPGHDGVDRCVRGRAGAGGRAAGAPCAASGARACGGWRRPGGGGQSVRQLRRAACEFALSLAAAGVRAQRNRAFDHRHRVPVLRCRPPRSRRVHGRVSRTLFRRRCAQHAVVDRARQSLQPARGVAGRHGGGGGCIRLGLLVGCGRAVGFCCDLCALRIRLRRRSRVAARAARARDRGQRTWCPARRRLLRSLELRQQVDTRHRWWRGVAAARGHGLPARIAGPRGPGRAGVHLCGRAMRVEAGGRSPALVGVARTPIRTRFRKGESRC